MAIADTYNGNDTRIKIYATPAGANFDTELAEFQEIAYAYINNEVEKLGGTVPVTGTPLNNMLKMAEAMIGAGLFLETTIYPQDAMEFGKDSQIKKNGYKLLQEWLDFHFGMEGAQATTFVSHVKVARPAHIAARDDDERDTI